MVYGLGAAIDSSETLPVVSGAWPQLKKTKHVLYCVHFQACTILMFDIENMVTSYIRLVQGTVFIQTSVIRTFPNNDIHRCFAVH